MDRDSVLADIHSHLAADWAIEKAMPALRRLGEDLDARRLAITSAADPRDLLRVAVAEIDGEDPKSWELATWALDWMAGSLRPGWRKEVLIRCLPEIQNEQVKRFILEDLAEFRGDGAAAGAIRRVFSSSAEDPDTRAATAGALLRASGDRGAFDFLAGLLSRPGEKEGELSAAQTAAVEGLVSFAEGEVKTAGEIAGILRALLARLRGYDWLFLDGLGRLRRTEDGPVIGKAIDEDPLHATDAIEAMALIHPGRAAAGARAGIRLALGGTKDGIEVCDHAWILAALGAREAIPEIEEARAAIEGLAEPGWLKEDRTATLDGALRVLRAPALEERVRTAIEFTRSGGETGKCLRRVLAERFAKEGAPPEMVASLREDLRRKRSTVDW